MDRQIANAQRTAGTGTDSRLLPVDALQRRVLEPGYYSRVILNDRHSGSPLARVSEVQRRIM